MTSVLITGSSMRCSMLLGLLTAKPVQLMGTRVLFFSAAGSLCWKQTAGKQQEKVEDKQHFGEWEAYLVVCSSQQRCIQAELDNRLNARAGKTPPATG
jgi:hypothetical protein